ncbi:hypothetical protein L6452_03201 [Arctium lappa]|uniref:Uncharacterized protein n=1 Tax=Arctium lappa TaxID=4217 RepID=A0ACB9FLQ5_ARCLA|nr:hypothetical protein L6452_03201 [Arctium lappa]
MIDKRKLDLNVGVFIENCAAYGTQVEYCTKRAVKFYWRFDFSWPCSLQKGKTPLLPVASLQTLAKEKRASSRRCSSSPATCGFHIL